MFVLQKGQIGSGNGGALGVVGLLWLFQKRGIKEKAWRRGGEDRDGSGKSLRFWMAG